MGNKPTVTISLESAVVLNNKFQKVLIGRILKDHPARNWPEGTCIRSSLVISTPTILETGSVVETMNTRYILE